MNLNKEEFLQTELGRSLMVCITEWDKALEVLSKRGFDTPDYKEAQRAANICIAKWDVYRMALKHFYGVDYHFTRTDEYFGVCTEDESDWLLKIDRHTGKEVPVTDTAELKVKITADTTEPQECLEKSEALPITEHRMQIPEAIEIIKKIKDECSIADANCGGCIYHKTYGECPLVGNPETWDI